MYGQETYFDHPHNTYVGWLFSGGILGLFAFLYLIFSSVYGAWKSAIAREEKNDLVLPIVFAFLVTYFVHIFFVFDNLTSTLLFAMCALYFGSHTSLGVVNIGITNESLKKYLSAGFTLVAVVLVILVVQRPALANSMTIEAMTYTSRHQGDPVSLIEGTKTTYENAINMNTLGTYEIREFYLQKSLEYIGLLPQVQDEKLKSAITNLAASAHSNFLNQVNQNPFDHRAVFMLGLYYLNIKNIDMAIPQLKKAVDLAPNKQLPLTYLAKAYLLKGDFTNASLYYEKAIEITPSSLPGKNALRLEYIQTLLLTSQDVKAVSMIRDLVPTANREEFNSLVSQMTQVFSARKDVNSIVKILDDASKVDPNNQNFVVWLAQALVAKGDFQGAVGVINRLSTSNPEIVAQFMSQLQAYIGALQEKQNAGKK